jgi:hypothetical protein
VRISEKSAYERALTYRLRDVQDERRHCLGSDTAAVEHFGVIGDRMTTLALYIPKPHELYEAILLLGFAYVVLCFLAARYRFSPWITAASMAIGCAIALSPDLIAAGREDLGMYGDAARKSSQTNHSDAFFAITSYLYVGRGKLVAFLGMLMGLIVLAAVSHFIHKKDRTASGAR